MILRLWTVFLWLSFCGFAHAEFVVDHVVAVVNDEAITAKELQNRMTLVEKRLEAARVPLPPDDLFQRQVLEQMILEKVQVQYAQKTGLELTDEEVEDALRTLAGQNGMSVAQFKASLEKEGVNFATFRETLQNELLITRLRQREINRKITVSDTEIQHFLQNVEARKNSTAPKAYQLAHIYIEVPEGATPEQLKKAQQKIVEIENALKSGRDFSELAVSYSNAQTALSGGMLGWKSAAELPEVFVDALDKLQPGMVTAPIQTPNGFHILKLLDVRSDVPMNVVQTQVRHILIRPGEKRSDEEARALAENLWRQIQDGANFADLARQYSDDSSKENGGDIGWISPGDTLPEFEQVVNQLDPGEISKPVRTPFGWHIIQVLGRRNSSESPEAMAEIARRQIHARKAEQAYTTWLRRLRDESYVEIMP